MTSGNVLTSGTWACQPNISDYRCEWLSTTLVERITLAPDARLTQITPALGATELARGVRDIVRFWQLATDQIVDKAFDANAEPCGYYSPVTISLERNGDQAVARYVWLGLLMDSQRRITVTGEHDFDRAVAEGLLPPETIEQAERTIRQLTAAAATNRWPPPLVRNFAILKEDER